MKPEQSERAEQLQQAANEVVTETNERTAEARAVIERAKEVLRSSQTSGFDQPKKKADLIWWRQLG